MYMFMLSEVEENKVSSISNLFLFVIATFSGPFSRTPESRLSELIRSGLTTIIGVLGTDGVTRR